MRGTQPLSKPRAILLRHMLCHVLARVVLSCLLCPLLSYPITHSWGCRKLGILRLSWGFAEPEYCRSVVWYHWHEAGYLRETEKEIEGRGKERKETNRNHRQTSCQSPSCSGFVSEPSFRHTTNVSNGNVNVAVSVT